ncbi:hypothetical protein AB1N83_010887 [Pleurotus pulmonarius]
MAWSSFSVSLFVTGMTFYAAATLVALPINLKASHGSLGLVGNALRCIANGYLMFICQIFLSWRIHQLARRRWLLYLICSFSVLQWGANIAYSVTWFNFSNKRWSLWFATAFRDGSFAAWLASNIACDLIITLSMIWLLRQARAAATFKPTKSLLGRIFRFTLETGLITTVWMTVQLILFLQQDAESPAYLFFGSASGLLYTFWLLATLNARSSFNRDLPACVDVSNLLSAGELRFKHPTAEGTEVVISVTTSLLSIPEDTTATGRA